MQESSVWGGQNPNRGTAFHQLMGSWILEETRPVPLSTNLIEKTRRPPRPLCLCMYKGSNTHKSFASVVPNVISDPGTVVEIEP